MLNIDFLDTEIGKQVFEQGKIVQSQKILIDFLKLRFKDIPYNVLKMIQDIGSLDILIKISKDAFICSNLDIFNKKLLDTLSQTKWKKASKKIIAKKRGTDEAFYGLMKVSGRAVLKLIGFDHEEAEKYFFKAVVLKEKRLEPDIEGIPIFEKENQRVFLEFQSYSHEYIRYNIASKILTACSQEKYPNEVCAAIIYTEQEFQKAALPINAFSDQIGNSLTSQIKEIVLTDYTLTQLMEIDPRLVILAPFTVPQKTPNSALTSYGRIWKKGINKAFEENEQKEATDVLGLFLLNRFRNITREEIKAMLDFDILDTVAGKGRMKRRRLRRRQK